MAGKGMLTRFLRLYFGGYDLSGDSREVSEFDNSCPEVDMTAISNTVTNYLAERRMVGVRGYRAFLNDAAGGASAVLNSPQQNIVTSAFFGNGAAPVFGDMAYILPGAQLGNNAEFSSNVGLFSSDFVLSANYSPTDYKTPWGVVLYPATSGITTTTNGSTHDLGATYTNGGHGSVHLIARTGALWTFSIQQSATGAFAGEETTLLTFALNGTAIAGSWKSAAGTVERYIRFRIVKGIGVGTITVLAAFAVN